MPRRPDRPALQPEHPLARGNTGVWQLNALYPAHERAGTAVRNLAAPLVGRDATLNAAVGAVPVAGGELGIPFNGSSDYLNGGTGPSVSGATKMSFWLRWTLRVEPASGAYAGVISQWNDPTPSSSNFQLFSFIAINNFLGRAAHSLDWIIHAGGSDVNATVQYTTADLGAPWTTVGSWDGATMSLWTILPSGLVKATAVRGGTLDAASGASTNTIVGRQDSFYANMVLLGAAVWKGRALGFKEFLGLHADPWALVRPPSNKKVLYAIPSDSSQTLTDTVTWSRAEAVDVYATQTFTLAWGSSFSPPGDSDWADQLLWSWDQVQLPETDDTLLWADAFQVPGVDPETQAVADTLAFAGTHAEIPWILDSIAWSGDLPLPDQFTDDSDALGWLGAFAADTGQLATTRYRR